MNTPSSVPLLHRRPGFTLVEILITLTIMAVIGMLSLGLIQNMAGQGNDADFKRRVQQGAVQLESAFERYKADHQITAAMKPPDITSYLDYVSLQTTGKIDDTPGIAGGQNCTGSNICLVLKSGGVLLVSSAQSLGTTDSTSALTYDIDPDGLYSGTTNGQGLVTEMFIYSDGALRSWGNLKPHTYTGWFSNNSATPASDPSYFNWN